MVSLTKLRLRCFARQAIGYILWIAASVMSKVFGNCLHTCVKFAKQWL